jgi:hypothetical protein
MNAVLAATASLLERILARTHLHEKPPGAFQRR